MPASIDVAKRISETEDAIRKAGIPDCLNRWIGLTPDQLSTMEQRMKAMGPKEAALRQRRESGTMSTSKAQTMTLRAMVAAVDATKKPVRGKDPSRELAEMTAAAIGHAPINAPAETAAQPEKEQDMATKTSKKKAKTSKAKTKVAKKPAAKRAAKAASGSETKERGIRPGSKLEIVVGLLKRPQGCTSAEILAACQWPAVSVPQMARSAGLTLRKSKDDKVTRYWGS